MTMLDSREADVEESPRAPEATPATSKETRAAAIQRTRRIAAIALVGLVVFGAVFLLFDGPIANAWNSTRQHQLASQWAATRPHVGSGHTIGLLQVPALHMNLAVAEGDSPQQLRSGPGHRIGTPMPGDIGNSVIVGHHKAWGGSFERLSTLKPGDFIAMQTKSSSGPIAVFTVLTVRTVAGNDVSPFGGATDHRITIVTGAGGRYSDRRLVVTAVSGPVGRALPPAGDVRATTPGGSLIWNAEVGLVLACLAVGLLLAWLLHRRYSLTTIAVVVIPFALLALLALLLNLDAALPALR